MSDDYRAQIASLGSILGVWAHPDDETIGCGGILASAVQNGQAVACVTASRGELGIQDTTRWPAEQLAAIRTEEMKAGLELLGITQHSWLDYPDGACETEDEAEAVDRIVQLIEYYKPDTIITFPPDGLTGHPDHRIVSSWAQKAAEQSAVNPTVYFAVVTQEMYNTSLKTLDQQFNIFFALKDPVLVPTAECDLAVTLPPSIIMKKIKVLESMPSQYARWIEEVGVEPLLKIFGQEALVTSAQQARWAGL